MSDDIKEYLDNFEGLVDVVDNKHSTLLIFEELDKDSGEHPALKVSKGTSGVNISKTVVKAEMRWEEV